MKINVKISFLEHLCTYVRKTAINILYLTHSHKKSLVNMTNKEKVFSIITLVAVHTALTRYR